MDQTEDQVEQRVAENAEAVVEDSVEEAVVEETEEALESAVETEVADASETAIEDTVEAQVAEDATLAAEAAAIAATEARLEAEIDEMIEQIESDLDIDERRIHRDQWLVMAEPEVFEELADEGLPVRFLYRTPGAGLTPRGGGGPGQLRHQRRPRRHHGRGGRWPR